MNPTPHADDLATLAELESRARELESELAGIQAAIASLHARLHGNQAAAVGREVPLSPAWDSPIPVSLPPQSQPADDFTTDTGDIYLQSLHPHHPLRDKWGLGRGLEAAVTPEISKPAQADEIPVASEMRLFGLMPSGAAWECRIPFTVIAQSEGYILGRDPELAHTVLEDFSISRAHAQLRLDSNGLVLSDMGSTNGSSVNGVPLTPYDNNRPINDGDNLTLGCINLQVEFI